MEVVIRIPDWIFRRAKTLEQVAEEMKQAAAVFWVARGDVAPEAAGEIAAAAPPTDDGTLYEVLMKGPDMGDDADFERPRDMPRELPEWDT